MERSFAENEHEEEDVTDALYAQFSFFLDSDQHERVLEVGTQILSHQPENDWIHHQLGNTHRQLENYPESETHHQKAIAIDPGDANNHLGLGWLELSRQRPGKAYDSTKQALALDPDHEGAWFLFGHLHIFYDDFPQAISCVQQIRRINAESHLASELELSARTDIEGATQLSKEDQVAAYEKRLSEDPDQALTYYHLGLTHFNRYKDYPKAEDYFRQALRLDPADKDYQKVLIQTLRKRDPILRTLWMPFTPCLWILKLINWSWEKKWPLIFMFFIMKYFLVVGVALAIIFYALFWPLTKVYEYLTIADLHKKAGRLHLYSGPMAKLHKSPFGVRMGLFLLCVTSFWTFIAFLLSDRERGSEIMGGFSIVVMIGFFVFIGYSWFATFRESSRKRKFKKDRKEIDRNLS